MKWIVEKGPAPEFRDLAKFWKEQIFSLLDLDGREIRSFLVMRSAQFKQLTKPTYYAEFPHDARRPVGLASFSKSLAIRCFASSMSDIFALPPTRMMFPGLRSLCTHSASCKQCSAGLVTYESLSIHNVSTQTFCHLSDV